MRNFVPEYSRQPIIVRTDRQNPRKDKDLAAGQYKRILGILIVNHIYLTSARPLLH